MSSIGKTFCWCCGSTADCNGGTSGRGCHRCFGNPLVAAVIRNPDPTVVDAKRQTCRCTRCGDEVPLPLGAVEWVTSYIKAFAKAHRGCVKNPTPGQTRVSIKPVRSRPSRPAGSRRRRAG